MTFTARHQVKYGAKRSNKVNIPLKLHILKAVLGHFGHGHFGLERFGPDISAADISATENAEGGRFGHNHKVCACINVSCIS